jgi:FO synthase subunit 1
VNGVLTYSRNVFIPVTDLCRNRCSYCSFRRDLDQASIISRRDAIEILELGSNAGCTEALFSMGELPWTVAGMQDLLRTAEIDGLIDYLIELCELALERDLLPHTNAGILGEEELMRIAPYNASMGLMLETTGDVLAHRQSPGKRPDIRTSFIEAAGRLKIPFTTGILVGIGEDWRDRQHSLETISKLHKTYSHIQEVIIQPFDPKPGTPMGDVTPPGIDELIDTVRLARKILPDSVALQIPPNLVDPRPLAEAGATDLGGLSPITLDWINPEKNWPSLDELRRKLKGYQMRERLPVYPQFIRAGWHGMRTQSLINRLADDEGFILGSQLARDISYQSGEA